MLIPVLMKRLVALLLLPALLWLPKLQADPRCFAFAETYYEQLYCEIQAQNPQAPLPEFVDFKRNPPMTQALLVKPLARVSGIKVVLPARTKTSQQARTTLQTKPALQSQSSAAGHVRYATNSAPQSTSMDVASTEECSFSEAVIRCGASSYRLVGNQANQDLSANALDSSNRLQIREFTGNPQDSSAVDKYLLGAYELYIDKMLEIGLAGATLNYGKFSYLFYDLREKGVSFTARFETMYEFLKKDKQNTRVSTSPNLPNELNAGDCYQLARWWICSQAGKNYIFQL